MRTLVVPRGRQEQCGSFTEGERPSAGVLDRSTCGYPSPANSGRQDTDSNTVTTSSFFGIAISRDSVTEMPLLV